MGENGTNNLDELSDIDYRSEAEAEYYGQGGTGQAVGFDDADSLYSAEESKPAVDETSYGNDFSADFTGASNTDPFSSPFGKDNDEDGAGAGAEDDDDGYGAAAQEEDDFIDQEGEAQEDFDGEPEDDGGDEEDEDGVGEDEDDGGDEDEEEDEDADGAPMPADDGSSGVINWKKGDKITLDLFRKVWDQSKDLKTEGKVGSAIKKVKKSLLNALAMTPLFGPDLQNYLRSYHWCRSLVGMTQEDFQEAYIDEVFQILDNSQPTTNLFAKFLAGFRAIFMQHYTEAASYMFLKTTFKESIEIGAVKEVEKFFRVVVPKINKKHKKNKK